LMGVIGCFLFCCDYILWRFMLSLSDGGVCWFSLWCVSASSCCWFFVVILMIRLFEFLLFCWVLCVSIWRIFLSGWMFCCVW